MEHWPWWENSARAREGPLAVCCRRFLAARIVADLEQSETIRPAHFPEAINFCMLDRDFWTW